MVSELQSKINKLKEQRIQDDLEEYGKEFFVLKKKGHRYVVNEEQKEFIINTYSKKYEDGKTLGRRFDKSSSWINARLKQWGIPIKSSKELMQLHSYNEDYFEVIDTEEKAYWLGMLYADGTLTHNKLCTNGKIMNRLKLTLQSKDKEHLELLAKHIELEHYNPKTYYTMVNGKEYSYCELMVSSTKMIEDLMDKGMIPTNNSEGREKKELIRFPNENQVPKHLLRHFVRGYFDGDGSLTRSRSKGKHVDTQHYTFKIVSNKIFCEQLKEFFRLDELEGYKESVSNVYKLKDKKYIHTFECGGNHRVYHIYNLMYRDATIYLDRKNKRIKEFLNYYKENNLNDRLDTFRPKHWSKRINYKTNKIIFN
ncbi:TPA: hypothetical protein R1960_002185 [Staphylococcus delphini]|nr:hypothetical protein [Staphylococcus delphini]